MGQLKSMLKNAMCGGPSKKTSDSDGDESDDNEYDHYQLHGILLNSNCNPSGPLLQNHNHRGSHGSRGSRGSATSADGAVGGVPHTHHAHRCHFFTALNNHRVR